MVYNIESERLSTDTGIKIRFTISGVIQCCRCRNLIICKMLTIIGKLFTLDNKNIALICKYAKLSPEDPTSLECLKLIYKLLDNEEERNKLKHYYSSGNMGNDIASENIKVPETIPEESKDRDQAADKELSIDEHIKKYSAFEIDERTKNDLKRTFRAICWSKSDLIVPFSIFVECEDEDVSNEFFRMFKKDIEYFSGKTVISLPSLKSEITEGTNLYGCGHFDSYSKSDLKKALSICKENKISLIFFTTPSLIDEVKKDESIWYEEFRIKLKLNKKTDYEKKIIDKLLDFIKKNGFSYTDEFERDIEPYIRTVYPKARLKDDEFIADMLERLKVEFYNKPYQGEVFDADCIPFYIKPDNTSAKRALENMVGLERLKKEISEFENFMHYYNQEKKAGRKIEKPYMNMLFLGNPGTGKTTAAKISAHLLYEMGFLKKNTLVTAERKDLVGEYIGKSAPQTNAVIKKAIGGVLFIDEAYSLTPHSERDYGREVISTLLTAMQDHKDDLVVIFAGYTDEMNEFVEYNPGMRSRIGFTFHFDNYSNDELCEIFKGMAVRQGYEVSEEALQKVCIYCEACRHDKHFGNGRFIEQLFGKTLLKYAARKPEETDDDRIIEEDIPEPDEYSENASQGRLRTYDEIMADINGLVGLDQLKEEIKKFSAKIKYQKIAAENGLKMPEARLHMLFLGNPGTGKTTVAKLMSELLYSMGITPSNKLTVAERKDLIAKYVGHTAIKTSEVIEKSLGGVLLIDEAYSLVSGSGNDFGGEAIATLLTAMEDHKNDLVVIFAGYTKEMQDFIDSNSGLLSRIGYTFNFEDYSAEQLLEMYDKKLSAMGYEVTEFAKENALSIINKDIGSKNFGNARYIEQLVQKTLDKHINDVVNGDYSKSITMISGSDVVF